jgi:hypothetical protein
MTIAEVIVQSLRVRIQGKYAPNHAYRTARRTVLRVVCDTGCSRFIYATEAFDPDISTVLLRRIRRQRRFTECFSQHHFIAIFIGKRHPQSPNRATSTAIETPTATEIAATTAIATATATAAHRDINMKIACFAFLLAGPAWALRGGSRPFGDVPEPVHRDLAFDTAAIFNTPGIPTRPPRTSPPTPAVPQTCTFTPDAFESQIIVEFEGSPDGMTEQDMRKIEDYVVQSYTEASVPLCDQEYREIFKATIADNAAFGAGSRNLQAEEALADATSSYSSKRKFSYRFFVVGTCRACKKDSVFFDDGLRRKMQQTSRRELQTVYARAGQVRVPTIAGLAENIQRGGTNAYGFSSQRVFDRPDIFNGLTFPPTSAPRSLTSPRSCVCDNPNGLNKAPTAQGFAANLDNNVKSAGIPGIVGVLGVAEVRQIDCETGLSDFTAEATIEGVGVPDAIQTSELDLMGDAFVSTYNSLAYESCDPTFKTVKSATFTVVPDSTSTDAFDGRRLQRTTRQFKFRIAVTGVCKMCPKEDLLFNDALRRYLSAYEPDYEHVVPEFMEQPHRQLGYVVNNDTCFCAVNAPKQAQGALQFTTVFNTTVSGLIVAGNLTNVESIQTVIVQRNDNAPSAAPSGAPSVSVSPSMAPSKKPTTSPTPGPTVSPTAEPTAQPTLAPTADPTLAPTLLPTAKPITPKPTREQVPSESPQPSPSPSIAPSLK